MRKVNSMPKNVFLPFLYQEDSVNRDSLDLIERCLFLICLDKSLPLSFNHQRSVDDTQRSLRDDVSLAKQMLHGHGARFNSCNRWFDKTLQVCVAIKFRNKF